MTDQAPRGWAGWPQQPEPGMEPWQIAKLLVGVPFHHMGRSVRGCDCVGLLVLVGNALNLDLVDSPYYGREPTRNNNSFQLIDHLRRNLGEPVDRPYRPNDVVLMKLRPRFAPAHVGIVAPHRWGHGLVHSYGEINRVVHHRIDDRRRGQITEVFQWPAKD